MAQQPWWRGAVIYQVYPRSFMDANNDGVGDLRGVIEKMPYIKSLGVDGIWLSPFFKSPMKDFGYDISDYRDVDPLFGNMDDFTDLMAKAKELNLKIIIDQVLSHTSDEHAWFLESREDRTNPKADWYVWADAKPDGSPPNNWLSIFGGVAWQWEPRRQQYYLHNFLTQQPDLNFHHPEVRAHVMDNVKFWLELGVDGFRLDAINFCFHDKLLRDNPAKAPEDRQGRGFSEDNPYAFQYHYYNNTQPEMLDFLCELRELIDQYPNTVTLGEISSEDSLKSMAEYTAENKRLHMAYSFELLTEDNTPAYIGNTVSALESYMKDGWPCWAIGNHDVARVASRWGGESPDPAHVKMLNAMIVSLRGSVCVYQGEELGLTEASVPFESLQDPFGIAFWPTFKGRDGCRTPMPWDADADNAGFSAHDDIWLPIAEQHQSQAVSEQEYTEGSVLNAYKHFIHWRKHQPCLQYGDIEFFDLLPSVLSFKRVYGDETVLCAFNFSNEAVTVTLPSTGHFGLLDGHGFEGATLDGQSLTLPPFGLAYVTE